MESTIEKITEPTEHEAIMLQIKNLIFDKLQISGATQAIVEYNGSGDSGCISNISILPTSVDSQIIEETAGMVNDKVGTFKMVNNKRVAVVAPVAKTLEDCIADVCYDLLEITHNGWEINEGSYGHFTFDVSSRKITLDHDEYVTDTVSSTHEF